MRNLIERMAVATALGLTLSAASFAAPTVIDDVNGYTISGNQLRHFSALAFDHGRVLATGEGAAFRKKYPSATVLDGEGRTLLPGLIDAHGHVLDLGLERVQIQLTGTESLREAQQRIRDYARAHPDQRWLQGGGWNQVIWKLGRFPLASELDQAVSDRPAVLSRIDGHAEWLNTKALQMAGITKATADPPGGRIERDAAGNPSGVLVDHAMDLVDRVVPPLTDEQSRSALLAAFAHMNSVGLTGVADAGVDAHEIALYRQLADQGRIPLRAYVMIRGSTGLISPRSQSRDRSSATAMTT